MAGALGVLSPQLAHAADGGACITAGAGCTAQDTCCSGATCVSAICVLPGDACLPQGGSCTQDVDCCQLDSLSCIGGICGLAPGGACLQQGSSCTQDVDCCQLDSLSCIGGICRCAGPRGVQGGLLWRLLLQRGRRRRHQRPRARGYRGPDRRFRGPAQEAFPLSAHVSQCDEIVPHEKRPVKLPRMSPNACAGSTRQNPSMRNGQVDDALPAPSRSDAARHIKECSSARAGSTSKRESWIRPCPRSCELRRSFRYRLVGVVRAKHALTRGEVTAARYAASSHVTVARPMLERGSNRRSAGRTRPETRERHRRRGVRERDFYRRARIGPRRHGPRAAHRDTARRYAYLFATGGDTDFHCVDDLASTARCGSGPPLAACMRARRLRRGAETAESMRWWRPSGSVGWASGHPFTCHLGRRCRRRCSPRLRGVGDERLH